MKKATSLMLAIAIALATAVGFACRGSTDLTSVVKIDVPHGTPILKAEVNANLDQAVVLQDLSYSNRDFMREGETKGKESIEFVALHGRQEISFYRWRQEYPNFVATKRLKSITFGAYPSNLRGTSFPLRT